MEEAEKALNPKPKAQTVIEGPEKVGMGFWGGFSSIFVKGP